MSIVFASSWIININFLTQTVDQLYSLLSHDVARDLNKPINHTSAVQPLNGSIKMYIVNLLEQNQNNNDLRFRKLYTL